MGFLKVYTTIPFLPTAISILRLPVKAWKYCRSQSSITWNQNDPKQNFTQLSQAKSSELSKVICPKQLYDLVPYLHQGHFGFDNQEQMTKAVKDISNIASICTGICIGAIPILRFFNNCCSREGMGVCTQHGVQDFLSISGLPLMVGAYLISKIANSFIFESTLTMFTADTLSYGMRVQALVKEYGEMQKAVENQIEKPADDPEFIATAKLAQQFLRLSPHIERELHESLAIDKNQAKTIILPLQTICRQFVAKAKWRVV